MWDLVMHLTRSVSCQGNELNWIYFTEKYNSYIEKYDDMVKYIYTHIYKPINIVRNIFTLVYVYVIMIL
jgi:hypothetical protein